MFCKSLYILSAAAVICVLSGCCTNTPTPKFQHFFSWGAPVNDTQAARYASAGVTDILVYTPKQSDLAVKHGMIPYCGVFTPAGPHLQVLSREEEKYHRYINGLDMKPNHPDRKTFKAIINRRRMEKRHRFGGENEHNPIDTVNNIKGIPCFNSDPDYTMSKQKLDRIIAKAAPEVKGICFDYLGYTNQHGCYCENCVSAYREFLKSGSLSDTVENRNIFYRDKLVAYYNAMIDYVKKKRPDFKVVVHIYPVFRPEPLYGNRTKADFCGQTAAWYFQWPLDKVSRYTRIIVERAAEFHPGAVGVPFVGVQAVKGNALAYKSPEQLELELQTILAAGGRSLQVCSGRYIIAPGYYEIFKRYCQTKK